MFYDYSKSENALHILETIDYHINNIAPEFDYVILHEIRICVVNNEEFSHPHYHNPNNFFKRLDATVSKHKLDRIYKSPPYIEI